MRLGIIQSLPLHPGRVARTESFSKFQSICGMLEREDYLAAHAACHATMNGMSGTLAADADIGDAEAVLRAAGQILDADDIDALVIPGLVDAGIQARVCEFLARGAAFGGTVFFDAPREAGVGDVVARQRCLPRFATMAYPYVLTVTPGRREGRWLPPSCVVSPLALGAAEYLRGVHELAPVSEGDRGILEDAGVALLCDGVVGRRRLVVLRSKKWQLAQSPEEAPRANVFLDVRQPGKKAENPESMRGEDEACKLAILSQIEARAAETVRNYPRNDKTLWEALKRSVRAVLMHARDRREIVNFHVRCDEETASWGTPEAPVVEVILEFPKRVQAVRIDLKKD